MARDGAPAGSRAGSLCASSLISLFVCSQESHNGTFNASSSIESQTFLHRLCFYVTPPCSRKRATIKLRGFTSRTLNLDLLHYHHHHHTHTQIAFLCHTPLFQKLNDHHLKLRDFTSRTLNLDLLHLHRHRHHHRVAGL